MSETYLDVDEKVMKRRLFSVSMIILALAGMGLVFLNSITNADPELKLLRLHKTMWKFEPPSAGTVFKSYRHRGWWKLVLAGAMVAGLVLSVTSKIIESKLAILSSVAIFVLWTLGLLWYWYKVLTVDEVPKAEAQSANQDYKVDDGWKARVVDSKQRSSDKRLPITIVTGFLGSGKTTLVKKILANTVGLKVLVIENEIGTEGIDHELLMQQTSKEDIILMNNGCICCTVRQDLLTTFRRMFSNDAFAQLDWIVIETTGLADPAPLIQSFYMDKECQSKLRLDGVLTVVDCKHLPIHLAKHRSGASGAHGGVSEAVKQIAYADRVLLSKMDLVRQAEVEALKTSIAEINRNATIFQCSFGNVDICEVLNINAFSPQKAAALMTSSTDGVDRPILIERGSDGKIVKKNTRLAFAANVDASKQSKQSSSSVMTVSLVCDEPVDLNKFNVWMSGLLKAQGPDIYRMKGILSMDGYDEKFVIQVIHMIFDGDRAAQWAADEPRRSKLVIIGTNLDRQQLEYGFIQTIAEK